MLGRTGAGSPVGTSATSSTVTTSQPNTRVNSAASADPTAIATTRPSERSGVLVSTTMSVMVTSPTTTVGRSNDQMFANVSTALNTRFAPTPTYPVRFASWPSTMLTPTAVTKPTITAVGTKRSIRPAPSAPATIMMTPVSMASVYSARSGSGRVERSVSDTMSAIALVACTAMNELLVNSAAPAIPNRKA